PTPVVTPTGLDHGPPRASVAALAMQLNGEMHSFQAATTLPAASIPTRGVSNGATVSTATGSGKTFHAPPAGLYAARITSAGVFSPHSRRVPRKASDAPASRNASPDVGAITDGASHVPAAARPGSTSAAASAATPTSATLGRAARRRDTWKPL